MTILGSALSNLMHGDLSTSAKSHAHLSTRSPAPPAPGRKFRRQPSQSHPPATLNCAFALSPLPLSFRFLSFALCPSPSLRLPTAPRPLGSKRCACSFILQQDHLSGPVARETLVWCCTVNAVRTSPGILGLVEWNRYRKTFPPPVRQQTLKIAPTVLTGCLDNMRARSHRRIMLASDADGCRNVLWLASYARNI